MMTRRKARENAFIAVFEAGFSSNDINEILALTQEVPEYEDYAGLFCSQPYKSLLQQC